MRTNDSITYEYLATILEPRDFEETGFDFRYHNEQFGYNVFVSHHESTAWNVSVHSYLTGLQHNTCVNTVGNLKTAFALFGCPEIAAMIEVDNNEEPCNQKRPQDSGDTAPSSENDCAPADSTPDAGRGNDLDNGELLSMLSYAWGETFRNLWDGIVQFFYSLTLTFMVAIIFPINLFHRIKHN